MKRRNWLQQSALALLGTGAIILIPHDVNAEPSGKGQKGKVFTNSLGMKFVPVPGTKILMCTMETTVEQWKASGLPYEAPEFSQGSDHPAVNISWDDAKAWCEWLSKKEGKTYRLPTDHEWSSAVGIGRQEKAKLAPDQKDGQIKDEYPWGNQWPPPHNAGNYKGEETKTTDNKRKLLRKGFTLIEGFSDQHSFTAPVGSYLENHLGLYDLGGNVSEWCEDQFNPSFNLRLLRGGSWNDVRRDDLASSRRLSLSPVIRSSYNGFRCVMED